MRNSLYWGDGILNIVRGGKWCPLNIVECSSIEGQGFGVLGRLYSEYSARRGVVSGHYDESVVEVI